MDIQPLDQMATRAGDNLNKAESNALKAYTINENDRAGITALAKELGIENPDKVSLEGVQLFAKRLLDKMQTIYEAISQLFNLRKRTQEVVTNNIGR